MGNCVSASVQLVFGFDKHRIRFQFVDNLGWSKLLMPMDCASSAAFKTSWMI